MKPMDNTNITIRKWLIQNNYEDIAESIDTVMTGWSQKKTRTRRSWWDILAGSKGGKPRTVEGVSFPVLKAAQLRKGVPVTKNAICRNMDEVFPSVRKSGRWANINERRNK